MPHSDRNSAADSTGESLDELGHDQPVDHPDGTRAEALLDEVDRLLDLAAVPEASRPNLVSELTASLADMNTIRSITMVNI